MLSLALALSFDYLLYHIKLISAHEYLTLQGKHWLFITNTLLNKSTIVLSE